MTRRKADLVSTTTPEMFRPAVRRCGSCALGCPNGDKVACGAAVGAVGDQVTLPYPRKAADATGPSPIWAIRKYNTARLLRLLAGDVSEPPGSDCDAMDPDDGTDCAAWEAIF